MLGCTVWYRAGAAGFRPRRCSRQKLTRHPTEGDIFDGERNRTCHPGGLLETTTSATDPGEPLDAVSVRVLGSLVEKASTTPDNYPLTLNALTAACNQATNREPVMDLDAAAVAAALADLDRRSLVRMVYRSDSRAKRYRHLMQETMSLHPAEIAVMCVLMLRGAQTAGEIRTRTARQFEFTDLVQVDLTLQALMTLSTPLVVELPRRPGQKEVRYAHLLAGEPLPETDAPAADVAGDPLEPGRMESLEHTVAALRTEVAELRAALEEFRRQFE
jgi:uncharacterized protein